MGEMVAGFRELKVWQRAKDLAVLSYRITDAGGIARDFGLKDQIRRAAVSVPSNSALSSRLVPPRLKKTA